MVGLMIDETAYDVALTAMHTMVTNYRSLGHIQTSNVMVLGDLGTCRLSTVSPLIIGLPQDFHGGMRVTIGTAT